MLVVQLLDVHLRRKANEDLWDPLQRGRYVEWVVASPRFLRVPWATPDQRTTWNRISTPGVFSFLGGGLFGGEFVAKPTGNQPSVGSPISGTPIYIYTHTRVLVGHEKKESTRWQGGFVQTPNTGLNMLSWMATKPVWLCPLQDKKRSTPPKDQKSQVRAGLTTKGFSVAFCSLAKKYFFSGLIGKPIRWQHVKVLTSRGRMH